MPLAYNDLPRKDHKPAIGTMARELVDARNRAGLTQEQARVLLDIKALDTISRWETGRRKPSGPSYKAAMDLYGRLAEERESRIAPVAKVGLELVPPSVPTAVLPEGENDLEVFFALLKQIEVASDTGAPPKEIDRLERQAHIVGFTALTAFLKKPQTINDSLQSIIGGAKKAGRASIHDADDSTATPEKKNDSRKLVAED